MGFAACGLISPSDAADAVSFQSGETQTTIVELFTSQGCSSCPPAEAWLNRLADDPQLWKTIVPVAFHVDYWDNLGWKDPFATKFSTERQRKYHVEGRAQSVYTPCFVVNGNEWRGWFERQPLPKAGNKNVGILSAELNGRNFEALFAAAETGLDLHVTVLGSGTETDVTRGENRGRRMQGNFVALEKVVTRSEAGAWSITLPIPARKADRYAVAFWVTLPGQAAPLQATGGWLPSGVFE